MRKETRLKVDASRVVVNPAVDVGGALDGALKLVEVHRVAGSELDSLRVPVERQRNHRFLRILAVRIFVSQIEEMELLELRDEGIELVGVDGGGVVLSLARPFLKKTEPEELTRKE